MEVQKKRETLEEIEKQETEASESESEVLGFRPIVVFYPDGKCIHADLGDNLLELAEAAGMHIDSSCGGRGVCGKCKVMIKHGEVMSHLAAGLTEEERKDGYVLACQSEIIGDVVVEVPMRSQLGELQILQSGVEPMVGIESMTPLTQKVDVVLTPPSLEDNSGDLERIVKALRRQMQEGLLPYQMRDSELHVDPSVLRKLPRILRGNDWRLAVTITDSRGMFEIVDAQPIAEFSYNYGIAIDVGTTTIVVHLLELDTGRSVAVQSGYNGQMKYGEDVIARIMHTEQTEDGLEELRRVVVDTINSLILDIAGSNGISLDDITCAVCAGNTTMTHLLMGIEASSIRREPYIPVLKAAPVQQAKQLELRINPQAPVYFFPSVGVYVGGDIIAGVLATGMADSQRLSMLIDVGTNGEIVLGNDEWLMCCSCSAGPAFEGCGIKHGIHAVAGAIESLKYDPDADVVIFRTIGGRLTPRGICGSGLIDSVATLLRSGVIDRSGKIDLVWPSPRVRIVEDEPQFVFVWGEEVGREDDIFLTEADIQNLMRSKSAVYAGARLLLQNVGLDFADVEQILIAGGFGNYLDIENAVIIGLLPDVPLDRIQFMGNTSAAGTRLALLSDDARQKSRDIFRRMTYLELMATGSKFMNEFMAALFLPHTNASLFPSVMNILR